MVLSSYHEKSTEKVPKLGTDNCLNAILRFIARRGKPNTITSDNGTSFVGAERVCEEYVAAWYKEVMGENLIQREFRWKFTHLRHCILEE